MKIEEILHFDRDDPQDLCTVRKMFSGYTPAFICKGHSLECRTNEVVVRQYKGEMGSGFNVYWRSEKTADGTREVYKAYMFLPSLCRGFYVDYTTKSPLDIAVHSRAFFIRTRAGFRISRASAYKLSWRGDYRDIKWYFTPEQKRLMAHTKTEGLR